MSKTFRTVGSGSEQTTEPIENNKIPIYDTKADAEADLTNLTVNQIVATKDEGNETSTPVDVVEDGNMHAVTSNAVADSLSYSTEETLTGGKWIDGKSIYRKVVDFDFQPEVAVTVQVSDNVGLGYQVVDLSKSYITKSNSWCRQPWFDDAMDNSIWMSEGELSFTTTHTSGHAYIVCEYTKTTD